MTQKTINLMGNRYVWNMDELRVSLEKWKLGLKLFSDSMFCTYIHMDVF